MSYPLLLPRMLVTGPRILGVSFPAPDAINFAGQLAAQRLTYVDGGQRTAFPATGRAERVDPLVMTVSMVIDGTQAQLDALVEAEARTAVDVAPGVPVKERFADGGTLARRRQWVVDPNPGLGIEAHERITSGALTLSGESGVTGAGTLLYLPVCRMVLSVAYSYSPAILRVEITMTEETAFAP